MVEPQRLDSHVYAACTQQARKDLNTTRYHLEEICQQYLEAPYLQRVPESVYTFLGTADAIEKTLASGPVTIHAARTFAYATGAHAARTIIKQQFPSIAPAPIQTGFSLDPEKEYTLRDGIIRLGIAAIIESSRAHVNPAGAMLGYFDLIASEALKCSRRPDLMPEMKEVEEIFLEVPGSGIIVKGFTVYKSNELRSNCTATFDDVVGNREAVEALRHGVRNLLRYNPATKKNYMVTEFGGFIQTFLLKGEPGCGKSLTTEAAISYAQDKGRELGRPIIHKNLSNAFKSEYFSVSARNLQAEFDEVNTGGASYILTMDDFDTVIFSREETKGRPEDKAILGTALNFFEGIGTPRFGNYLCILSSNRTFEGDEAFLRRIRQFEVEVVGPETPEDYSRLLSIKLRNFLGTPALAISDFSGLGKTCCDLNLSGSAIDTICKRIKHRIQSIDEPADLYRLPESRQIEVLWGLYAKNAVNERHAKEIIEEFVHHRIHEEQKRAGERVRRLVEA